MRNAHAQCLPSLHMAAGRGWSGRVVGYIARPRADLTGRNAAWRMTSAGLQRTRYCSTMRRRVTGRPGSGVTGLASSPGRRNCHGHSDRCCKAANISGCRRPNAGAPAAAFAGNGNLRVHSCGGFAPRDGAWPSSVQSAVHPRP